jgi:hypothetical protein
MESQDGEGDSLNNELLKRIPFMNTSLPSVEEDNAKKPMLFVLSLASAQPSNPTPPHPHLFSFHSLSSLCTLDRSFRYIS